MKISLCDYNDMSIAYKVAKGVLVTAGVFICVVAIWMTASGRSASIPGETQQVFVYTSCTIVMWTWMADKNEQK